MSPETGLRPFQMHKRHEPRDGWTGVFFRSVKAVHNNVKAGNPGEGSLLRENGQTEEKAEARPTFQNDDTRRPIVIPVLANP